MKRFSTQLLALSLFSVAIPASSATDWFDITHSDLRSISVQKGSQLLTTNKAGQSVISITGRIVDKKDGQTELSTWYVTLEDCVSRKGSLVSLKLNGEYKFENDFAFGAGSIGSDIAEFVCDVAEEMLKKREGKGI